MKCEKPISQNNLYIWQGLLKLFRVTKNTPKPTTKQNNPSPPKPTNQQKTTPKKPQPPNSKTPNSQKVLYLEFTPLETCSQIFTSKVGAVVLRFSMKLCTISQRISLPSLWYALCLRTGGIQWPLQAVLSFSWIWV